MSRINFSALIGHPPHTAAVGGEPDHLSAAKTLRLLRSPRLLLESYLINI
jgi:hypothetical protein